MADGKQYANHRKDLLPMFLVSKKMKWDGEKASYANRDTTKVSTHGAPSPKLGKVLRDTYMYF